jgi:hypothetical protein
LANQTDVGEILSNTIERHLISCGAAGMFLTLTIFINKTVDLLSLSGDDETETLRCLKELKDVGLVIVRSQNNSEEIYLNDIKSILEKSIFYSSELPKYETSNL